MNAVEQRLTTDFPRGVVIDVYRRSQISSSEFRSQRRGLLLAEEVRRGQAEQQGNRTTERDLEELGQGRSTVPVASIPAILTLLLSL